MTSQSEPEVVTRLRVIEEHVLSQDRDKPGALMRLDRLETIVKLGVAAAGIGLVWKVLDVLGTLIAVRAVGP